MDSGLGCGGAVAAAVDGIGMETVAAEAVRSEDGENGVGVCVGKGVLSG